VAVTLHLIFPRSSGDATGKIAWGVVLLVCGIVTYVAALQRYGTIDAVGGGIASVATPLVAALLLCAVAAVTSAFASSAGILGAMVPLALPLMAQGTVSATGVVVALALSATIVDATPFSTVGALVVANAEGRRAATCLSRVAGLGHRDGGHGPGHRLAALHFRPVPLNGTRESVCESRCSGLERRRHRLAARAPAISSRSGGISW
jgi:Na+/phosphate symporter